MSLTPRIIPNNWTSVQQAVAKLASLRLGVDSTPTFAGLTLGGLTASRLLSTDTDKTFASADLASWVTETANQVLVADDGDGTITLSLPQDIDEAATPTFGELTLDGDLIPGTSSSYNIGTSSDIWDTVYCIEVEATRDITLKGGLDSDIVFMSEDTTWFRIEPKNAEGDIQFLTPLGNEICFSIGYDEVMKLDSSGNLFIDGMLFSSSPVRILEAVQIQDDLVATNYIRINHNSIISNTGAISFGDENLILTGILNASSGKVRVTDNDTTEPTSEDDGYVGVANTGTKPRLFFNVKGAMYYLDAVAPASGSPIGLLLTLTYA